MSNSERRPDESGSGDKNNSHTSTSDDTSYVKMAEVDTRPDPSLIGHHCQYEYCNQLDFLPFFCQSCRQTFCLDHRTESAHHCSHAGAWAQRRREAQLTRPSVGAGRPLRDRVAVSTPTPKPCATPACKTTVGTSLVPGVHCTNCNRDYCLKHRLREDHNCAQLTPLGARAGAGAGLDASVNSVASTAARNAKSALDKLRAWGAAKKKEQASGATSASIATRIKSASTSKGRAAATTAAALADLKRTSKGDAKVAPEKRVHLYVEAESESTQAKLPKGCFFYSRDWAVGRVLDAAARSLQIDNVNNQSTQEEDKLRVFHVEGGRLLDFNEKVGAALANGNTIVLLRGVGPPPSLLEL